MDRRTQFPVFFLAWIAALAVGCSSAAASGHEREPYIVVLRDSVTAPAAIAHSQADQFNGSLGFVYRYALEGYSIQLPPAAVEGLRHDPRVAYVTPDGPVEAVEEIELDDEDNEGPEIAEATTPTGISRTFAASNKALDIDGVDDTRANVDVAVLDTGLDQSHPDLNVVSRTDCTLGGESCAENSGSDIRGHGTHVAGTIAALDNNIGVVGVAPGARLWSVKVLDDEGHGTWSSVTAGVDWVTGHASQIEVANMSLAGFNSQPALEKALNTSTEAGVVYAVAAGNSAADAKFYSPAGIETVLTVSALADYDGKPGEKSSPTCENYGIDDHNATFSNYGARIDITAPGVCILSSIPGKTYGLKSGTSMATPHVAGAAAILASQFNPNSKNDVEIIQEDLERSGNFNWKDTSGDGIQEPLLDVHNEELYTLVSAPTVSTGSVAYVGVGSTTETFLTGTVNPNGLSTTYQFEYVTAAKYKPGAENPYAEGNKVPLSPESIGSGSKGEDLPVKQLLTGLAPGTVYHYRLVAENSQGLSKGSDQTFTSLSTCKGAEGKCQWSLQSPASPEQEPRNELADVSCPSSSRCVAVGSDHYLGNGFMEFWNGSKWKMNGTFSEMKAVSCPTASWCMTVAKNENGGWVLEWFEFESKFLSGAKAPPVPSGGTGVILKDVSCTSESACTVVGRYSASGVYKPYVARWNGSSWSLQSAPSPGEGSAFEAFLGVSCPTSSFCMATGTAAGKPFAERWNGSEWTVQTAPNPEGGSEASLEGVSCSTASDCMAVGSFKASGLRKTLTERWNGSSLTVVSSPNPSGKEGNAALRSVSCLSGSSCFAAGSFAYPASGLSGETTLVEAWNGSEWSIQTSPNPEGNSFSSFAGISCSSSVACTGVGQSRAGLTSSKTINLAERWE